MRTSSSKRTEKWYIRQIITALIMVTISVLGWLRLAESIRLWNILIEVGLNPPPLYLAMTGGLIGMFSLIAAISILIRLKWAVVYIRLCSILLVAWLIFDHLFLSHTIQNASDWIWLILFSSVFITAIFLLTLPSLKNSLETVEDE